jgi:hypothetical protein
MWLPAFQTNVKDWKSMASIWRNSMAPAVGRLAPFVGRSGYQAAHQNELRRCGEELDAILPKLSGHSWAYYTRLQTLARLALELS